MKATPWFRQVIHSGTWSELSNGECRVLGVLLGHVDEKSLEAWPSVETIAKRSGLRRRAVQLATCKLAKRGLMHRARYGSKFTLDPILPHAPPRTGEDLKRTNPTPPDTAGAPKQEEEQEENVAAGGEDGDGVFFSDLGVPAELARMDRPAATKVLFARGFTDPKDVARVINDYTLRRIILGIAHTDFIGKRDGFKKSWVHAFVAWLKSGRGPDPRLSGQRVQQAVRQAQVEAGDLQREKRHAEEAERLAAQAEQDAAWRALSEDEKATYFANCVSMAPSHLRPIMLKSGPNGRANRAAILEAHRLAMQPEKEAA
jgi:hypothetical protein